MVLVAGPPACTLKLARQWTVVPEVSDMATEVEIAEVCRVALEEESHWRETGSEGRKVAYERFQHLLHTIADLTGRTYEEVMNDAVEEWVTVHFCSVAGGNRPSAEWGAAAEALSSS